jgi:hypothetical protein
VSLTLADIPPFRELVLAGASEEEVALHFRCKRAEVRLLAHSLGLSFCALAKHEWCIVCAQPRAWIDPATGFCEPCTIKRRLERQRIEDGEEEERLREEAIRESNVVKQARKRMREEYGANPRKRQGGFDD